MRIKNIPPTTFLQWAWLTITVSYLIAWGTEPVRSFEPVDLDPVNISGFSVLNLGEPERVEKPAQKLTLELSVYHSKYDGRVTRWGRTYNHWGDMTCASNNPAHKNKVLRVTYGKLSATLFCNDTGGDKRLGYSRLDISGKAMKFFAPKWNGKDKGAPLLKGAIVEVL